MSVSTLLTNDVILDKLAVILQEKVGGGIVDSITAGDNITVTGTAAIPIVSMPIAGTWSATNNVVKSSADNVLEWGTDGDSLTFSAPLVDSGGVVSLPIAGTWAAGSNDVIKGSSATALFWANDNSKTYTATAPVDVTGTVISLPIAGTYSATNNVVKGSSATALEWGGDGDSLTFSAPLVDNSGVVSLPIAGTWSATNNVVMSSSATALQWGTDANTVYTGTQPVKVSGNAISLTIGGTFVAGTNDVVKGSASNALVWGPDTNTVYTATAPVDVTGTVISLPIAGTYSTSNNVVKGSSATSLEWGADGDSLTFSLPLLDTSGVVSLPIAGSFVAGVTDVVKGSASNALVWGSDSNSGGTVTSVAATANGYCTIAGTPSVAPTVGLNVTAAGTTGQYLTATGVADQLAFIAPPAPTVYTATAPVDVTGTVISLPIAGTWSATNNVVMSSASNALQWGTDSNTVYTATAPVDVTGSVISLPIAGTWASGTNDVVRGSSATSLSWGSGATAGVSSITQGNGISVTGTSSVPIINANIRASSFLQLTPTGSVLDLNAPSCPTTGYVLSSTAGGAETGTAVTMSWVAQPVIPVAIGSQPNLTVTTSTPNISIAINLNTIITFGNMVTFCPTAGGFAIGTSAVLPKGTAINLSITGLPISGVLGSGMSFYSPVVSVSTNEIVDNGEWTFNGTTLSFGTNGLLVASEVTDAFTIYCPSFSYILS